MSERSLGERLKSVVARGDGSREGLGLASSDPFGVEWQQRS